MYHLPTWISCLEVPPHPGLCLHTQVLAQAAFCVPSKLYKRLPSASIALSLRPLYPKMKLLFGGHWYVSVFHGVFAE